MFWADAVFRLFGVVGQIHYEILIPHAEICMIFNFRYGVLLLGHCFDFFDFFYFRLMSLLPYVGV